MKAWALHGIGDLRYEETARPVLKPDEVLVEVKAAGICGSDIPRIFENGTYSFPLIPGHEFSGVVVEAGAEADNSWLGKRAGVFPLIPCGNCAPCQRSRYEMCRNYSYIGSRRDGGFAEYVSVPVWNLIELPDAVSYEEAAMLEPMSVAVHAMRRTEISDADYVVICGLGTIGLSLLMFLLEAGINEKRILAVGNKESQKQTADRMGLSKENYCDAGTQDVVSWLMEHTNGNGADVFYECVGKNETYSQAVESMAPAGRIILVGNPCSDMELSRDIYWKILRNQLMVTGTWNSSFTHTKEDDWHYVIKKLSEKRIAPAEWISHRLPMERLEEGMIIMRDKLEDYGKIIGNIF